MQEVLFSQSFNLNEMYPVTFGPGSHKKKEGIRSKMSKDQEIHFSFAVAKLCKS